MSIGGDTNGFWWSLCWSTVLLASLTRSRSSRVLGLTTGWRRSTLPYTLVEVVELSTLTLYRTWVKKLSVEVSNVSFADEEYQDWPLDGCWGQYGTAWLLEWQRRRKLRTLLESFYRSSLLVTIRAVLEEWRGQAMEGLQKFKDRFTISNSYVANERTQNGLWTRLFELLYVDVRLLVSQ